jgi:hypothetical protein
MKTIVLLVTIALTNFALPVWAAETAATQDMSKLAMNPSKEDREKMAAAHAQMETCLRSDQEFMQCRDAFHIECQSMMGRSCLGMNLKKGMSSE